MTEIKDKAGSYHGAIVDSVEAVPIFSANVPVGGGLRSLNCQFNNKYNGNHQYFLTPIQVGLFGNKGRIGIDVYPKAKPSDTGDSEFIFGGGKNGFEGIEFQKEGSTLKVGWSSTRINIAVDATTWVEEMWQRFIYEWDKTEGNNFAKVYRNDVEIGSRGSITTRTTLVDANPDLYRFAFGKTLTSNGWSRPFYGQLDNPWIEFDPAGGSASSLQASYDFEADIVAGVSSFGSQQMAIKNSLGL